MRFELFLNCIKSYIVISLILWACSGLAYYANHKRATDDPSKKDMHPAAIFLTPFWPAFATAGIVIFVLRAVLYIFTLILFTIGLVVIRKPFILKWLTKAAIKLGNKLMKANMLLFRLLLPQQKIQPVE